MRSNLTHVVNLTPHHMCVVTSTREVDGETRDGSGRIVGCTRLGSFTGIPARG